jgi:hypothetical protein
MDPYLQRLDSVWVKVNPNVAEDTSSVFSMKSSVLAILHQALADPRTLVGFNELVSHPVIRHLICSDNDVGLARMIRTCYLFSTGTWAQYSHASNTLDSASQSQFLDLGPQQIQKLKGLTLVSFIQSWIQQQHWDDETRCSSNPMPESHEDIANMETDHVDNKRQLQQKSVTLIGPRVIPYTVLQKELDFKDRHSLEDFLIYCIYQKFVPSGSRLNPHKLCLMVACCPSSSTIQSTNVAAAVSDGGLSSSKSEHFPSFLFARDVPIDGEILGQPNNVLTDMISALENIQRRGQILTQTLGNIQSQSSQMEEAEVEKWSTLERQLEDVRAFTKTLVHNTAAVSTVKWGGTTFRAGDEKRQSKRSRGVGFIISK